MAALVYADQTDLGNLGISSAALGSLASDRIDGALNAASRVADSYIGNRFTLPLKAGGWGIDLRQAVCSIAAYRLMQVRGFNPESADAILFRKNYEDAIKWLEGVSKGTIRPIDIQDSDAGGENNTDDTGNARNENFVFSPKKTTCVLDNFWGKGGCTSSDDDEGRGW